VILPATALRPISTEIQGVPMESLSGRVELLLGVVRVAIPVCFSALVILFVLAGIFGYRYRRALKHKILHLPVRTERRLRTTFYVRQRPQR